ncbi:hypothetical protein ACFFX1_12675 [Dactylosporangium sucinum]|uniref:Uncharacterized protein n=1 Tax=Dactylosporangium sucinum TaxID=1424081 RepID=A0A917TXV9_9ACTN|nr:hypothetical protein [Dactylosporangium sucinum]GGM41534.1 hypothetical protein GCM10007977_048710 [Dactylosporangium sucinum]
MPDDLLRFAFAGLVAGLVTAVAGVVLVLTGLLGPGGDSTSVTFVEYGTVAPCQR